MFQIKVAEKLKTHNLRSVTFSFFFENRAVYEMSKNMMEPERPQTIWRLRVAHWIRLQARPCTHTHTDARTHAQKYLVLIAFPQHQWFRNAPQCYMTRTLPVLQVNKVELGQDFFRVGKFSPYQYHCTNAPYSFTHLPHMVYDLIDTVSPSKPLKPTNYIKVHFSEKCPRLGHKISIIL